MDGSMIKILVIDDEIGICDIIARTFSCIGFNVSAATSAERARALFRKAKPSLVFLDLVVGATDGLELLDEFKKENPEVIVIVVTAKGDPTVRTEALQRGADEYITKPFNRHFLRDIVTTRIKGVLDQSHAVTRPRILLVDDESRLRAGLRHYIEPRFDADILEAGDIPEALEKIQKNRPDVIFLDIKLPGLSGIDAIGIIKNLNPSSRIVIVSAWQSAEVVSRALALGVDDYLGKPVSLPVLGEKLKDLLLSSGKLIEKKVGRDPETTYAHSP